MTTSARSTSSTSRPSPTTRSCWRAAASASATATSSCSPGATSSRSSSRSIPGHEWAAEVVQVGRSVRSLGVGDRVVGECVIGAGALRLQHQRCRGRVLRGQGVLAAPAAGQPVVDAGRAGRAVQLRLLRDRAGREPRRERHRGGARRRPDRPRASWRLPPARAPGSSWRSRRPLAASWRARWAPRTSSTRPPTTSSTSSRTRHPERGRTTWCSRPAASPRRWPRRWRSPASGPAWSTSASTSAAARRRSSGLIQSKELQAARHHRLARGLAADPALPVAQRRGPLAPRHLDVPARRGRRRRSRPSSRTRRRSRSTSPPTPPSERSRRHARCRPARPARPPGRGPARSPSVGRRRGLGRGPLQRALRHGCHRVHQGPDDGAARRCRTRAAATSGRRSSGHEFIGTVVATSARDASEWAGRRVASGAGVSCGALRLVPPRAHQPLRALLHARAEHARRPRRARQRPGVARCGGSRTAAPTSTRPSRSRWRSACTA